MPHIKRTDGTPVERRALCGATALYINSENRLRQRLAMVAKR